jgi:hypothetical protein
MKNLHKYLVIALAIGLFALTGCEKTKEDIKYGRADYAAHGTKAFATVSVVMVGDKIEIAYIDEYQFSSADTFTCVPNGDTTFATTSTAGAKQCLASKRLNTELYSANMSANGGATKTLLEGYKAVEEYAQGKTIKELEDFLAGKTPEQVVDAVSSATLVDVKGYLEAIILAAKAAK